MRGNSVLHIKEIILSLCHGKELRKFCVLRVSMLSPMLCLCPNREGLGWWEGL